LTDPHGIGADHQQYPIMLVPSDATSVAQSPAAGHTWYGPPASALDALGALHMRPSLHMYVTTPASGTGTTLHVPESGKGPPSPSTTGIGVHAPSATNTGDSLRRSFLELIRAQPI
jgi:hypothetical protein